MGETHRHSAQCAEDGFPRGAWGVSRRSRRLSLKRCDRPRWIERSNPTCAGPYLYRNFCSNSPSGGVSSQRRKVTDGDEGAKQKPVREVSRFGLVGVPLPPMY